MKADVLTCLLKAHSDPISRIYAERLIHNAGLVVSLQFSSSGFLGAEWTRRRSFRPTFFCAV